MVSPPAQVQVLRLAPVVKEVKAMFEISFPEGVVMVTVESVIVLLEIVVGVLIVTIGGKLIVVVEEFPAVSYTVTVIV